MNIYPIKASDISFINDFYNKMLEVVVEDLFSVLKAEEVIAVMLKGAPARSEATVVELDSGLFSLSDVDLIIVSEPAKLSAIRTALSHWKQKINQQLADRISGIDADVITPAELSNPPCLINTYECSLAPTVLWGNREVTRRCSCFSLADISPIESFILFHNRVLEQFLVFKDLKEFPDKPHHQVTLLYRTGKLLLDLVTAFLYQEYNAPLKYKERVKVFTEIITGTKYSLFNSIRQEFCARLELWLNFKLNGNWKNIFRFYNAQLTPPDFYELVKNVWQDSIRWIEPFWRMQLKNLGFKRTETAGMPELVKCYLKLESLPRKIVRWAKTLRHPNIHRDWFSTGRTIRLLTAASPRYLVYLTSLLSYLRSGEEYASDNKFLSMIIQKYFPMRMPVNYSLLSADEKLNYLSRFFSFFYQAVLLNRRVN